MQGDTALTVLDWERIGLGAGPYRLVKILELSSDELHASDPDRAERRDAAIRDYARLIHLEDRLGRCGCCGKPASRVYVMSSTDRVWSLICRDCVVASGSKFIRRNAASLDHQVENYDRAVSRDQADALKARGHYPG